MNENLRKRKWFRRLIVAAVVVMSSTVVFEKSALAAPLKAAVCDIDATPPVGSQLANDIMDRREASLRLKGIVLIGNDKPIVLVAVDWIGIGGAGYTAFREAIATAVGTTPQRVAVHCLHQHDAPTFDLGAEALLAAEGLSGKMFNVPWHREVIHRAAAAAKKALANTQTVTHVGLGQAKVEKVASNRRILGADGEVKHVRWTATRDPKVRAFPEGTIDPLLKSISLYNGDQLLFVVSYYATHPQSYYRTGTAHPDFPGMAREKRQKAVGVPHVHFNGAGGNIGAGKYNDGSHENRPVLAKRMEEGMSKAHDAVKRFAVTAEDLGWAVVPVALPVADHLDEDELLTTLKDKDTKDATRVAAAKWLAFLRSTNAGAKTDITCLTLGKARVLSMPGELFVEYQLAAAKLRPDLFVAMAAYGDYAPGYIGTKIGYSQGGYETSQRASRVAPGVEAVLMGAIKKLLAAE